MNTLKLIIQAGCVLLLATIVLLLLAIRKDLHVPLHPASPTDSQASADGNEWKYTAFDYNGNRIIEEFSRKKLYPYLVFYDYAANSLETAPTKTNRVYGAEDILSDIAKDGWQFVWTNGSNYLTRRSINEGKHAYFFSELSARTGMNYQLKNFGPYFGPFRSKNCPVMSFTVANKDLPSLHNSRNHKETARGRDGRVAEGVGLLNRNTPKNILIIPLYSLRIKHNT